MTTPASYPTGANEAFGTGVSHLTNPGRSNVGSITLDGGLQADSARWDAMSPHSVLHTVQSTGTPADTDMSTELGQEAAGNTKDAALAQGDMQHALMRQAGRLGADDNIA